MAAISSACIAGGHNFFIDSSNLEAALYCHSKYDCPALDKAAKACMAGGDKAIAADWNIAVFKASARFNFPENRKKSARNLAKILPVLDRWAVTSDHVTVACIRY